MVRKPCAPLIPPFPVKTFGCFIIIIIIILHVYVSNMYDGRHMHRRQRQGGRSLNPACFEVGSLLSLLCCIRLAGPRFPSGLRVAEAMAPFVIAGFLHGFLESSSGS